MSAAAERIRRIGGAVAERDRPAAPEPVVMPEETDDPVRNTVDLDGPEHRAWTRWKLQTALRLEVHPSNVSTQGVLEEVVRALIDDTDDTVARAIRRRLQLRIVARSTRGKS